jgi:hypothetical protein
VFVLAVLLVGNVGILLEDKTCSLRRIVSVSLDSPYDGAVVVFLSRTDFVKDFLSVTMHWRRWCLLQGRRS